MDNQKNNQIAIGHIAEKIKCGERLSTDDALKLFESPDLLSIGMLADQVNRQKNDDAVFYNINRHINPTNICVLSCKFCAYSRKPGEEGSYAYSIDEMVQKAAEAQEQGATEVHMVGGLHPRWNFAHYKNMIASIKKALPDLHLKAFTVVELDWMARKERRSIPEILQELRDVGLGSLPGGGAEIFHPEVREKICDTKVDADLWLDTHRQAHQAGMHSNCTMLYGHIETYQHRVDHMRRLRDLQDETGGFNAFIPLSFQPFQNDMGIERYTFGFDDLKTIAVARLFLDNFQHIKAYWIMLGQDIAQLAMRFGANDLDGTVLEEKISRMAGGRAGMAMTRKHLEHLILKAGRLPVERDTLYKPLPGPNFPKRSGAREDVKEPTAQGRPEGDLPWNPDLLQQANEAFQVRQTSADQRAETLAGSFAVTIVPNLDPERMESVGETIRKIGIARADQQESSAVPATIIALDLAAHSASAQEFDPGQLVETVWALKHTYADLDISIWGLKSLWSLAQSHDADVRDLLSRLRDAGVSCVESSSKETETDLTNSEVVDFHSKIMDLEISSVAKAEITAPAQGFGPPQWPRFCERLLALRDLVRQRPRDHRHTLHGVSIEVAPASFVTPCEFFHGIALARTILPSTVKVVAPIMSMPVLSPRQGLGQKEGQDPVEKIAALALQFGADDLGHIVTGHFDPNAVAQGIRSCAFQPRIRDACFHGSTTNLSSIWDKLPVASRAPGIGTTGSAEIPAQSVHGTQHLPELRV